MATYKKEVQNQVKSSAGFVPKTCWIAHALDLLGIKLRVAPNRVSSAARKYPCPPEKRAAIIAALCNLGIVSITPTDCVKGAL
jgi:hypothetical protein